MVVTAGAGRGLLAPNGIVSRVAWNEVLRLLFSIQSLNSVGLGRIVATKLSTRHSSAGTIVDQ
jgi:hypothetical protein